MSSLRAAIPIRIGRCDFFDDQFQFELLALVVMARSLSVAPHVKLTRCGGCGRCSKSCPPRIAVCFYDS